MATQNPKEQVQERWKTKDAAADAIIALIGDPDGETKKRLKHASNTQLLTLFKAGEEIQSRFKTRDALEAEILKVKFPQGNVDTAYAGKLKGFGARRLLDMHRQLNG
jgi:hypothetical protein